jgi:acylphosphatase
MASASGLFGSSAFFARVSGRVQGVGFRYSAVREAQRLRLNGWVRNADSGDVETWAEGPQEALDLYLAWLHRGPSYSQIDSVEKTDVAPRGYRDFAVEY